MDLHFPTLNESLLHWGKASANLKILNILDFKNNEEPLTFEQLVRRSSLFGALLQEKGLKPGNPVVIMLPTSAAFVYLYYGTLLAGGVPVPTYPPHTLGKNAKFLKNLEHIFASSRARFFGTDSRIIEGFHDTIQGYPNLEHVFNVSDIDFSDHDRAARLARADVSAEDIALIQYTSGSTGLPKGVVLTHANLVHNIRAIAHALRLDNTKDIGISWLPLFHDMGLIGCLLTSVYTATPLALMPTEAFMIRPDRWLKNISRFGATISPSPNFGYYLCTRLIRKSRLKDVDLSSWRGALSGAEAVDTAVLDKFVELFEPHGFNRQAFLPAYGLAESSLAVTITPLGQDLKIARLDRDRLENEGTAVPHDAEDANQTQIVSVGKAVLGQEVGIFDPEGGPLPEYKVGEIWIRGPSVTKGYYNWEGDDEVFKDGWFKTGDLGFLLDEELYITGRIKELIIKRGRNYYPYDIEKSLWQIPGIREGRCAAFAAWNAEESNEDLVLIIETTRHLATGGLDGVVKEIHRAVMHHIGLRPDRVVFVPPKSLPKTSSGKLQRLLCKKLLDAKELEILGDFR